MEPRQNDDPAAPAERLADRAQQHPIAGIAKRRWVLIGAAAMAALLAVILVCGVIYRNGSHYSARGENARGKAYVASIAGEVYHRPSCGYARKIPADNLLGYDNRQDAEADGRRPCKVCKP